MCHLHSLRSLDDTELLSQDSTKVFDIVQKIEKRNQVQINVTSKEIRFTSLKLTNGRKMKLRTFSLSVGSLSKKPGLHRFGGYGSNKVDVCLKHGR